MFSVSCVSRLKKKFFDRSKSRIRRLSEHVRKEPISAEQCDAEKRKSFHLSCDDLRKDKSKSDTFKALFLEGKTILTLRM